MNAKMSTKPSGQTKCWIIFNRPVIILRFKQRRKDKGRLTHQQKGERMLLWCRFWDYLVPEPKKVAEIDPLLGAFT